MNVTQLREEEIEARGVPSQRDTIDIKLAQCWKLSGAEKQSSQVEIALLSSFIDQGSVVELELLKSAEG